MSVQWCLLSFSIYLIHKAISIPFIKSKCGRYAFSSSDNLPINITFLSNVIYKIWYEPIISFIFNFVLPIFDNTFSYKQRQNNASQADIKVIWFGIMNSTKLSFYSGQEQFEYRLSGFCILKFAGYESLYFSKHHFKIIMLNLILISISNFFPFKTTLKLLKLVCFYLSFQSKLIRYLREFTIFCYVLRFYNQYQQLILKFFCMEEHLKKDMNFKIIYVNNQNKSLPSEYLRKKALLRKTRDMNYMIDKFEEFYPHDLMQKNLTQSKAYTEPQKQNQRCQCNHNWQRVTKKFLVTALKGKSTKQMQNYYERAYYIHSKMANNFVKK